MKRKTNGKIWFIFALFFIVVLAINLFVGTSIIQRAAANDFHGGMCGACPSCIDFSDICQKRYGFDIYLLIVSLIPLSFITELLSTIQNGKKSTQRYFSYGLFFGLLWMVTIELLTRLVHIPVLYSHPYEGTQSLHYKFVTLFPWFIFIVSITEILIASVFGFVIGRLMHHFLKKKQRC